MRRDKPRKYLCVGGPYNHKDLFLVGIETLTFRVNKWRGYYTKILADNDLHWVDVI